METWTPQELLDNGMLVAREVYDDHTIYDFNKCVVFLNGDHTPINYMYWSKDVAIFLNSESWTACFLNEDEYDVGENDLLYVYQHVQSPEKKPTIEEQVHNAAYEAAVIIPNDCENIRVDAVIKEDDGTTVIRGTGEDTTDEYSIDLEEIIANPQDFTIFKFTEIKIK